MLNRRALLRSAVAAAVALPSRVAARQVKPPDELKRLHAIVAFDSNSNLGGSSRLSGANAAAAVAAGAPPDRLNLVKIEGDDLTPAALLRKVADLRAGADEAVLLYVCAHARFEGAAEQHVFYFGRDDAVKALPRKDMLAALAATKAPLRALVTEGCSRIRPNQKAPDAEPDWRTAKAGALGPVMRCLFFQHRGLVDITAAEKGTFSFADGEVGAVFTLAWRRALARPLAELDADKDGFLTWKEFFPQLREQTNRVFLERRPHWPTDPKQWPSPEALKQRAQFPLAFGLPEPTGRADGPASQRYRLGARVVAAADGVKVVAVADGSPAAQAGLKADDVILSVKGTQVRGLEEYGKLLDDAPQGKARLEVLDARTMKAAVKDVQLEPVR
jgi:hypothetical protein